MLFQVDAPISIYTSTWVLLETVFISVFVILVVTLFVCMSELNLMPAVLMRPKAPKSWKTYSFGKNSLVMASFVFQSESNNA